MQACLPSLDSGKTLENSYLQFDLALTQPVVRGRHTANCSRPSSEPSTGGPEFAPTPVALKCSAGERFVTEGMGPRAPVMNGRKNPTQARDDRQGGVDRLCLLSVRRLGQAPGFQHWVVKWPQPSCTSTPSCIGRAFVQEFSVLSGAVSNEDAKPRLTGCFRSLRWSKRLSLRRPFAMRRCLVGVGSSRRNGGAVSLHWVRRCCHWQRGQHFGRLRRCCASGSGHQALF